ncbi:MAG: DUF805 domain-containing protein [Proteobacteria bacterium]|nr:DUF805 domain-containing protein [Pseudomonadota bacterium]
MDKLLKYLSFQGRASRQRFWYTTLALVGVYVGLVVVMVVARIVSPILSLPFLIAILPMIVASFANSARRLHDRNKSAWWLLLFQGLPLLLSTFGAMARLGAPGDAGVTAVSGLLSLISLPISIWALVELGFLRGTSGPNKYGDDPLRPVSEVFA